MISVLDPTQAGRGTNSDGEMEDDKMKKRRFQKRRNGLPPLTTARFKCTAWFFFFFFGGGGVVCLFCFCFLVVVF